MEVSVASAWRRLTPLIKAILASATSHRNHKEQTRGVGARTILPTRPKRRWRLDLRSVSLRFSAYLCVPLRLRLFQRRGRGGTQRTAEKNRKYETLKTKALANFSPRLERSDNLRSQT